MTIYTKYLNQFHKGICGIPKTKLKLDWKSVNAKLVKTISVNNHVMSDVMLYYLNYIEFNTCLSILIHMFNFCIVDGSWYVVLMYEFWCNIGLNSKIKFSNVENKIYANLMNLSKSLGKCFEQIILTDFIDCCNFLLFYWELNILLYSYVYWWQWWNAILK